MSEQQKTVEEPVAAAPAATEAAAPVEATPEVKEDAPAAEPAAEAPAAEEPAAETAEAAEEPAKKEVTPVEEGALGYKGPGLLKSLIFQKKFFWFGTEPVESKSLSGYLRGEKPDVGNHNAAWAASTGKGLLFFSKKATEKSTPAGIINLSEAKDLTEDGTVDFHFTVGAHKHTFQAITLSERDNWVAVLKTKIAEAAEIATTIKDTDAYKSANTSLAPVVAAVPKKSTEVKKEDKTEAKDDQKEDEAKPKEDKVEKKEEKARKSRSASRKRASIFGSIFPKKEDAAKEESKEATPPSDATPEAAPEVAAPAEAEPATTESTETPAAAEPVVEAKPEEKPKPTKRASIFGSLGFNKKKAETEAPAVPAKDEAAAPAAEPVSDAAPVIPAPDSTEAPAATEAAPAEPLPTTEAEVETPVATKRKSSLPFGFGTKKEKVSSDDETEKPKSPFAKLRATVKGKKADKVEKTPEPAAAEAKAEDKEEEAAPAADAEEATAAPVVSEPVPAALASTPQVSATA